VPIGKIKVLAGLERFGGGCDLRICLEKTPKMIVRMPSLVGRCSFANGERMEGFVVQVFGFNPGHTLQMRSTPPLAQIRRLVPGQEFRIE